MYTYMHTYMHTYVHTCTYMYMHAHDMLSFTYSLTHKHLLLFCCTQVHAVKRQDAMAPMHDFLVKRFKSMGTLLISHGVL